MVDACNFPYAASVTGDRRVREMGCAGSMSAAAAQTEDIPVSAALRACGRR